ncbi:MAG: hypothetical protein JST59_00450 [Actinobacteria bacterium]|nr:hypothetical protein [Actinomycetota bacterium]
MRKPTPYLLQFLRKYIEMFPNAIEETRYVTHKRTAFDLVRHLIEHKKLHEVLLSICTSDKSSGLLRDESVEFLVFLVMKYKDRVASEDYLNAEMLLTLTQYSAIFIQLLHYFR